MTTPKKPKAHPEDAAKAVFRISTRKPADLVVSTNQLLENVKKHPQYGNQPGMQQAVTTMSGITDTLTKQDTDIQTARTGLIALMAARQLTVHSFMRARMSLLAVADEIAAGSAATLNEWGFGAFSKNTTLPPTDTPPTGLRVRYTSSSSSRSCGSPFPVIGGTPCRSATVRPRGGVRPFSARRPATRRRVSRLGRRSRSA